MELKDAKQKFIQAWGILGSSWGINRTMAQIHALLLVAEKPLSTDEIMETLNISRGNTNMNTRALMDWDLVEKILVAGERKEFFIAEKDIQVISKRVARQRKRRELEPVIKIMTELANTEIKGEEKSTVAFNEMITDLNQYAGKMDSVVDKFIHSDEHWFYKNLLKLIN